MNDLSILQNLFLTFELFTAIGTLLYVSSLTLSLWKGAPFVPSRKKDYEKLFENIGLKSDLHFLELGCGDGRVVCCAVKKYGVMGRGVDISPVWVFGARARARLMGISQKVEFKVEDILKTDMAWADAIYLYMMPRFLDKYAAKIFSKCKQGTLVISYVFDIPALKEKEIKEKNNEKYYIYKI